MKHLQQMPAFVIRRTIKGKIVTWFNSWGDDGETPIFSDRQSDANRYWQPQIMCRDDYLKLVSKGYPVTLAVRPVRLTI